MTIYIDIKKGGFMSLSDRDKDIRVGRFGRSDVAATTVTLSNFYTIQHFFLHSSLFILFPPFGLFLS